MNLEECIDKFKITMTRLGILEKPSAKSINDTLDLEVEPLMAFLPRRRYERDIFGLCFLPHSAWSRERIGKCVSHIFKVYSKKL